MFWSDICEIKKSIETMDHRICRIFHAVEKLVARVDEATIVPLRCDGDRVIDAAVEDIKETIEMAFPGQNTLDKLEDCMKNVDKLNAMINEFKGCVSMARGAIAEGKELMKLVEEMGKVADISQNIHKSMLSFIKAGNTIEQAKFFKIDAIYAAICEKQEKKSRKTRKVLRKKAAVSPAS